MERFKDYANESAIHVHDEDETDQVLMQESMMTSKQMADGWCNTMGREDIKNSLIV